MKRIQPAPWRVVFRQYDQNGKVSRPRILDAKGKPVRLTRARHAALMALAPELFDALDALANRAELLHLQIQSALGFKIDAPAELGAARSLLNRLPKVV